MSAPAVHGADRIEWVESLDLALEQARTEKKIVMVDFFTHWCHWCKVLDQKTFSDPKVVEASKRLVNVKVNGDTWSDLAQGYGVTAYPTVVFLKPDATVRSTVRGFQPPERFLAEMENAVSVGGQLLATRNQLLDRPGALSLREQYVELLALDRQWAEAAREVGVLLEQPEIRGTEQEASLALDHAVYRLRAGEDARSALEAWADENRGHPRELECRFHLAQALESAGDAGAAREGFESVRKAAGKTWLGVAAEAHLARAGE